MTVAKHWKRASVTGHMLICFLAKTAQNVCLPASRSPSSMDSGFSTKNSLQFTFLCHFLPPSRLWHWQGIQSAENLKHRQEFWLCTTGYWEVSQRKLLWILYRTETKSWHLAGSGLGQRAEFSQLLFKVTEWFCTLFCWLWVDFWGLKSCVLYYSCFHNIIIMLIIIFISVSCHVPWWFSSFMNTLNCMLQTKFSFFGLPSAKLVHCCCRCQFTQGS